jgi:hypothetical protein
MNMSYMVYLLSLVIVCVCAWDLPLLNYAGVIVMLTVVRITSIKDR